MDGVGKMARIRYAVAVLEEKTRTMINFCHDIFTCNAAMKLINLSNEPQVNAIQFPYLPYLASGSMYLEKGSEMMNMLDRDVFYLACFKKCRPRLQLTISDSLPALARNVQFPSFSF